MGDLREKAAQLIIPRLDGNNILEEDYFNQVAALVDTGIGGFILFGGRIPETPAAIRRLQERSKIPLLITSDIERGLGQQILGGTIFPSQWAVAEAIDRNNPDDIALLHDMLTAVREECIAAGIRAVFSPVADVNVNPDNPIICTRSFGEDPEKVSWFVTQFVKGLQKSIPADHSLFACSKHFPGHGDTAVDSHTSLPVINADRKRLERVELSPFKAAIDAGVAMIMVGHLQVPALEPEPIPATFSKYIVTNLLRKELGFNGLIVTDALDMGALKAICDEGEAAVRALEAGCDILLHPSEPLRVLDAVIDAVENGRLLGTRIDEAFARVMDVKKRFNVGAYGYTSFPENLQLAYKIAKKAIKVRKGRGLSSLESVACFVIDDDGDGSVANPFLNGMKERIPDFRAVSNPSEVKDNETVVVPIFSKVSAWKGRSGLTKSSCEQIKKILEKAGRSAIVSFGSPYILNNFDSDVMIDAFDPADFMQRAVVQRLFEMEDNRCAE